MTTSVVIPNWNGKSLLQKNLPMVLKIPFDEYLVVDDASQDGSTEFLQKNFPQVKTLVNKKNKGFSYTVNRGVGKAKGDIVFLLNSDVLPKNNIIPPVMRHFKDPKVFGVSLREEGYWWARPKFENGFLGHEPGEATKSSHITLWISGGSGTFRKSMWEKLGGMDTLFSPFYWEDLDLSYRALKHGWKLVWEPTAVVEHKHESTINPENFSQKYLDHIKERNQLLFQWKHLPTNLLLTKHLLGVLWRLKNPGYAAILLLALANLPTTLLRRIQEKKVSNLSTQDVLAKFGVKI